nr:WG repeat-containing protein [Leptospira interrogans]
MRRYGLLSLDGKIRTSIQYDSIYKYSKVDALARVSIWGTKEPNDRLYGFINIHGEEIIPPKYTFASEFSDGMAKVHKGEGSPTYIDRSGKELILDGFFTREYEEEATFNDGLLRFRMTGQPQTGVTSINRAKWRSHCNFRTREPFTIK